MKNNNNIEREHLFLQVQLKLWLLFFYFKYW